MTLLELECFYNVALLKSISKTAEKLFLTQPSVSKHLMHLEKELGFSLFVRSNKGVILTRGGQQIFQHCQLIMEQVGYINESAENIRAFIKNHNIFHISSVPTLHLYGIMPIVGSFMKQHQSYDIIMDELDEDRVLSNLSSGLCDMAFCSDVSSTIVGYNKIPVAQEGFSALVSKKYIESTNKKFDKISDFDGIPLIVDKIESGIYHHLLDSFREYGVEPNVKFTCSRSITAAQYILFDDAFYVGFDSSIKYAKKEEHVIIPLPDIPRFNFCFFWPKDSYNEPLEFFIRYLKNNI